MEHCNRRRRRTHRRANGCAGQVAVCCACVPHALDDYQPRPWVGGSDKTAYGGPDYLQNCWTARSISPSRLRMTTRLPHRDPQRRIREWLADHPTGDGPMRRDGRDYWRPVNAANALLPRHRQLLFKLKSKAGRLDLWQFSTLAAAAFHADRGARRDTETANTGTPFYRKPKC